MQNDPSPVCEYSDCDDLAYHIACFKAKKNEKYDENIYYENRYFACITHSNESDGKFFSYKDSNAEFPRVKEIPEEYKKIFDADIERIGIQQNDILIFRSNRTHTNLAMLHCFTEYLRIQQGWQGGLIVLKEGESIEKLSYEDSRTLYYSLAKRLLGNGKKKTKRSK